MDALARFIARGIRVYWRIGTKKWNFFGLFALFFVLSVGVLAHFDLLPSPVTPVRAETPAAKAPETEVPTAVSEPVAPELPIQISIPTIGLSANIANPSTTNAATLDRALLKGAVRYPTSAELGEGGNVVLFGHSSYLPVVGNPAYKTFNGIQKLKVGDTITVYSTSTAYTYRVRSVAKESANDAAIPLSVSGRELTLATCDSFAEKTDRFIVVADFVESHSGLF